MRILTLLIAILLYTKANSQTISSDVISSGGGYFVNSYSSMSITIGETVTETISNNGITLTQGFQQNDYNITEIEELNTENINVTIFPNPATDLINLKLVAEYSENLSFEIFDITGREILKNNLEKGITQKEIDFSSKPAGIYILKIHNEVGTFNKTVKIEKLR